MLECHQSKSNNYKVKLKSLWNATTSHGFLWMVFSSVPLSKNIPQICANIFKYIQDIPIYTKYQAAAGRPHRRLIVCISWYIFVYLGYIWIYVGSFLVYCLVYYLVYSLVSIHCKQHVFSVMDRIHRMQLRRQYIGHVGAFPVFLIGITSSNDECG